jgi:hypothetical protein
MFCGAQQTRRNFTEQQRAQQNQPISLQSQSDMQDRSQLMPTIGRLPSSQGRTPQQQSRITQRSLSASNTAFHALREKVSRSLRSFANESSLTGGRWPYGHRPLTGEKLCDEKGIETPHEPPIRWVNVNSLDGDGEG